MRFSREIIALAWLLLPLPLAGQIRVDWYAPVWLESFSSFNAGGYEIGSNSSWDASALNFLLTPDQPGQSGKLLLLRNSETAFFKADFFIHVGSRRDPNMGADGIVFTITRQPVWPPSSGGQLNFLGADGVGIEFDTYFNPERNDPGEEHIALIRNAADNHLHSVVLARNALKDNNWHQVEISNVRGKFEVILDGRNRFEYTIPFPTDERGYFGFTSATGASYNPHRIDAVRVYAPSRTTVNLGERQLCDSIRIDTTLVIRNNTGRVLSVSSVSDSVSDGIVAFTAAFPPLPLTLLPLDSIAFPIAFTIARGGPAAARLRLTTSDSDYIDVRMQLLARSPVVSIAAIPAFPRTLLSRNSLSSATYINSGNSDLSIDSLSIVGPDAAAFTVVSPAGPAIIPSGDSLSIVMRFTPTHKGDHTAFLRFHISCPLLAIEDLPLQGEGYKNLVRFFTDLVVMGRPGNRVRVALRVLDNPAADSIMGLAAEMRYDRSLVSLVGIVPAIAGWNAAINPVTGGHSFSLVSGLNPLQDTGRIADFVFDILGTDTGRACLDFSDVVLNPSMTNRLSIPDAEITGGCVFINPSCRLPDGVRSATVPELNVAPNPSRTDAVLTYTVPMDGHVKIALFDVLGRKVKDILDAWMPSGEYTGALPAPAAEGIYFVRLVHGGRTAVRKFIFLR